MREYLFRGKREYNGKWVEGSLLIWSDGSTEICHTHPDNEDELLKVIVYPETVGQFTGLYDSTKWKDLTDAEKLDFYHQHYIGEDGMSVRFQNIDDVKHLWKGKRIFEGDIVHVHDRLLKPCAPYHEFDGVIAHKDGSFVIVGEIMTHYRWLDYDVTVLGNIHDQPELLETE